MSVIVDSVIPGSPADKAGVIGGDLLLSVNDNEIDDVLDYRFFADEYVVRMAFARGDKTFTGRFMIKGDIDSCGLRFASYLMSGKQCCANKCIFCFIDQMPPGMRKSLYFKDDDSRLSFLFGNYITLTNLDEREIQKIIRYHISPMNISVHTMEPELRVAMMKNPRAGSSLSIMRRFADAGISINAQLVLCHGINDADHLAYSLRELDKLYPGLLSIAAVPAGLTSFRSGLPHIEAYDPASAGEVIDMIDDFNSGCGHDHIAYAADEFFLIAGREIPPASYYGSYPQLENGVGMLRSFEDDFTRAVLAYEGVPEPLRACLICGSAAAALIERMSAFVKSRFPCIDIEVFTVINRFFGLSVTVTGLLTGKDIIAQLNDSGNDCEKIIVPAVCLKSADEPVFLDDVSLDELSHCTGKEILLTDGSGSGLADLILGGENNV